MKFKKTIPYSRQSISSSDILKVNHVLKSDYLTQGNFVFNLEKKLNKIVKAKYSILTNSGTSALHLSCLSLDLKKNDIVWTVPNTFAATVNAPLLCGAKIDFVDIELDTFNICLKSLEKKLLTKVPKLLIVVHFAGLSPDMQRINFLAKKYKFKVIEDASHSFGGKYRNEPIGNCNYSDISTFSFHPVKTITSAEGGLITTNSKQIYKKIKLYREHGIFKKKTKRYNGYDQKDIGFNYRMSNLHAALLQSQIKKIRTFLKRRHKIKKLYDKELDGYEILTQKKNKFSDSTNHLYVIVVKKFKKKLNRDKFINILKRKHNIYSTLHYPALNKQLYFKKYSFPNLKNSAYYSNNALSLPIYPNLSEKNLKKIFKILKMYLVKND
jgi:dTDP-4-amino-4,6-dideoxygalactose transaminase